MIISFSHIILGITWFTLGTNSYKKSDTAQNTCTVTIDTKNKQGVISPCLMGFNIIYNYTPDSAWESTNGIVHRSLKELRTHLLRYPGGTVTTFYHWAYPTGQGHKDSWDHRFDSVNNTSPVSMMDIDEYLSLCKTLHTEPLVGINMGSGIKYKRITDGIQEALSLMEHCKEKRANVNYFYLDNEPYQNDANYTYTADEYAEMVNRYAAAMKKSNPDIKIIVNTKPIWKPIREANLSFTKTLITKAGKNIDYIDVHDYWAWGHASFNTWKKQIPMQIGATGLSYAEQRPFYQHLAASLGYPEIDMISLEWNIGPPGSQVPPTQAEATLMIAEQYIQLIQSGMKLATFWPAHWPKVTQWSSRALLRPDYQPNKVLSMFRLFTPVLGQNKVKSTCSEKGIQTLAVESKNRDTLWLYLINKVAHRTLTKVHLETREFSGLKYSAVIFNAGDTTKNKLKEKTIDILKTGPNSFSWNSEAYSLTRMTFIK